MQPETINLDELSIEQLEALCFRLVEQQTSVNNNLQLAQQELNKKRQTAQKPQLDLEDKEDTDQSE